MNKGKVIVAIGGLAGLAGLIYAVTRNKPGEAAPPLPPGMGQLVITSTPSGSQITINGDIVGSTPLTLNLAPGSYSMTLSLAGYEDYSTIITVVADQMASIAAVLIPVTAPPPAIQEIILKVSRPSDSINRMFHRTGFWACGDHGFISMGAEVDWERRGFAALFRNVNIPRGAAIIDAYLRMHGYGPTYGQPGVNEYIAAEASDNATPIADEADWESRMQTVVVDWGNITPFIGANPYDSPNLASVIQATVDRPGWVPDNAIQIMANDDAGRSARESGAYRTAWAYSGSPLLAPELHIAFRA